MVGCVLCLTFALLLVFWLATRIPAFYRERLPPPLSGWSDLAFEFERRTLDLANNVRRPRPWQLELTDAMVNGWLAADLPTKFPGTLPSSIRDPRVAFIDEELALAFTLDIGFVRTVPVLRVRPQVGDQLDELIVEIRQSSIGWLPVSVSYWRRWLDDAIRSRGIGTQWIDSGANPTLVLRFPESMTTTEFGRWEFEILEIVDDMLVLRGKTRRR